MDGQLALAIVVGHIDLTAQCLLQALFHLHRQGAARDGLHRLFGGLGQLLAQGLCLPDVQLMVGNDLCRLLLQLRGGQAQHHLCVARGKETALQQLQHRFGQVEQTQAVGQRTAALAQFAGGLLLGQVTAGHQLPDAQCFFHRVQILALKVFHQRQLHGLLIRYILHDDGCLGQARHPAGTPTALTGHDEIAVYPVGPHRDGLQ